jgi:hypothetical protein
VTAPLGSDEPICFSPPQILSPGFGQTPDAYTAVFGPVSHGTASASVGTTRFTPATRMKN